MTKPDWQTDGCPLGGQNLLQGTVDLTRRGVAIARVISVVSLTPHYSASNSHTCHMMPFHFEFIRRVSFYTNKISDSFSATLLNENDAQGQV